MTGTAGRSLALAAVATLLAGLPCPGSESASYRLTDEVFNAGGRPAGGLVAASAGYRATLEAVGEPAAGVASTSGSFRMDAGFHSAYAPPREVVGLVFTDPQTLQWAPEGSGGVYHLYRDGVATLPGLGYGACFQPDLTDPVATDPASPPATEAWFDLVTSENRLGEEGTKGAAGDGMPRSGSACP